MLNFVYSWNGYRGLKVGLFLDFFFKKFFVRVLGLIFYFLNLIFLDKFLIEFFIKKFLTTHKVLTYYVYSSLRSSFMLLLTYILTQLLIVLVVYMVLC